MQADAGEPISVLNVDGGASANDFLMQFQSDLLQTPLARPHNTETTALGAAYLAGLCTGFWKDTDELCVQRKLDSTFSPTMPQKTRQGLLCGWHEAIGRTRGIASQ